MGTTLCTHFGAAGRLNRTLIPAAAFACCALASCAAMRLVVENNDFLVRSGFAILVVLHGAVVSWIALPACRHSRPVLCWSTIGLASGIAGAGAYVLVLHLLTSLVPMPWLPSHP